MWVEYDYNTYGLQVFKMKSLLKLLLMFLLSLLNRILFLPLLAILNCSFSFASLVQKKFVPFLLQVSESFVNNMQVYLLGHR